MKKQTSSVRIQQKRSSSQEHSVPVYLTSSFVFESAEQMKEAFDETITHDIYSRYSNPNVNEFVEKVCVLEGAEAGYAMASGMGGIFSTFAALLSSGDEVLSIRSVFGATHTLFTKILPKWNIKTNYVSCTNVSEWEKTVTANTKLFYIETPTNPGLELVDLKEAAAFCKKHKLLLVVDNCFATPVLQRPIEYGADIVIHSATKYFDGQGRVLGGVAVGKKDLIQQIYLFCRSTGPSMSPFNAWVLSKSLETLKLRVEKHCDNALAVAELMGKNPEVQKVSYPFLKSHPQFAVAKAQMSGGGGIVTFELTGGYERAVKFLNTLKMISISANLGDTRSIVTHPASSTHSKLTEEERLAVNISQSLIRCSVGLEEVEDVYGDIAQAIEKSK
jgi:O-succinylhomoserine sulfhydrylase